MSTLSIFIEPLSYLNNSIINLMSVLFPDPLFPTIATFSPAFILKEIPLRISLSNLLYLKYKLSIFILPFLIFICSFLLCSCSVF